jgi:hypothetical protein
MALDDSARVPKGLDEDPDMPTQGTDVLRLMTMRSDDQFNTSIYSEDPLDD